jgi:hypothetical protein
MSGFIDKFHRCDAWMSRAPASLIVLIGGAAGAGLVLISVLVWVGIFKLLR